VQFRLDETKQRSFWYLFLPRWQKKYTRVLSRAVRGENEIVAS